MTSYTIDKKITGFKIIDNNEAMEVPAIPETEIEQMHEKVSRPELLLGSTYKIKTPLSDHALYITINDIILNADSEFEVRRPFEIFINSKNLEHYQWVVALTRVVSAVFRKGGDVTFLVEELKVVFDPAGGYFKSGGRFMPSLVAEIGDCIETHLKSIGLLKEETLSEVQQQILQEKQAEYADRKGQKDSTSGFPADASLCLKCHTKAMIIMDGCKTCLSCGDSKCG